MIKITVKHDDITRLRVDAIVNAANSYGYMGGGVAGAIKKYGGEEIEMGALSLAPIPVGHAVVTTAGSLVCGKVIHASTMEQPAQNIDAHNVKEATMAALECALENKLSKIAIPGLGTGVGGVPYEAAAKAMAESIFRFDGEYPKEVVLCDKNEEMVDAFRKVFGVKDKVE